MSMATHIGGTFAKASCKGKVFIHGIMDSDIKGSFKKMPQMD